MDRINFQTGDNVVFRNKTGEYAGRIFEMRSADEAIVETRAVLSHPTQGDLHNPNQVDVPLFHQRKAMSFREKTVVRTQMLSTYNEELPDYHHSLRQALHKKMEKIRSNSDEWSKASMRQLKDLEKDYFGE